MDITQTQLSGLTRREHDLIGEMDIPVEYYFGVQTYRALENFRISGMRLCHFPEFVRGLAEVKQAAALANRDLGLMENEVADAIVAACQEISKGSLLDQFVVDMVQGGAGTSTNMNANEVIANRALEIMGHQKGEYEYCHPNNHVNLSQSTNDAYPTSVKVAMLRSMPKVVESLKMLITAFRTKACELTGVIKMGRTQLQDAVPMTLGQEFEAYAAGLEDEISRLEWATGLLSTINMGATAIGTGINADPDYAPLCTRYLSDITGFSLQVAPNMIQSTNDTSGFLACSATLRSLAVKLSKICNDLRLLSSGPRAGLHEINLPPMQPGSSIMPGKVNPVIPEVVNQIAFRVIGNDVTATIASEAAQLELNVMEPIIVFALFESIEMLINGMDTLRERCVQGITANAEVCQNMVHNSIGLVTALNPYLGYEASSMVAKEALSSGRSVYDLVLEHNLMSKTELDDILRPENMIAPRKINK